MGYLDRVRAGLAVLARLGGKQATPLERLDRCVTDAELEHVICALRELVHKLEHEQARRARARGLDPIASIHHAWGPR